MTKKVIALSADYGYLNPLTALVKSIFYHHRDVKIYVINSDIPQEWFSNINNRVRTINGGIVNCHIDPSLVDSEHVSQPQINALSYGRILIPRLIPEDRVLYLDSDTIVNTNLDELFDLDLGDAPLAAIPDVIYSGDFNSGVMLLNNRRLRTMEPSIVDRMLEFGQQSDLPEGDQSVLNHFFNQSYYHLGYEYNYVIGYDFLNFYYPADHDLFENFANVSPKIIHYPGPQKPWYQTSSGRWREIWWRYADLEWSEITARQPLPDIKDYQESGQVLTFTNDENLLNIQQLVAALPNVTFNITAWTPMGGNLQALVRYPNVHLYPSVVGPVLDQLKTKADCYLDINYGGKEDQIMDWFVQHHKPILSFKETATPQYVNSFTKTFANDDAQGMINFIRTVTNQKE